MCLSGVKKLAARWFRVFPSECAFVFKLTTTEQSQASTRTFFHSLTPALRQLVSFFRSFNRELCCNHPGGVLVVSVQFVMGEGESTIVRRASFWALV